MLRGGTLQARALPGRDAASVTKLSTAVTTYPSVGMDMPSTPSASPSPACATGWDKNAPGGAGPAVAVVSQQGDWLRPGTQTLVPMPPTQRVICPEPQT